MNTRLSVYDGAELEIFSLNNAYKGRVFMSTSSLTLDSPSTHIFSVAGATKMSLSSTTLTVEGAFTAKGVATADGIEIRNSATPSHTGFYVSGRVTRVPTDNSSGSVWFKFGTLAASVGGAGASAKVWFIGGQYNSDDKYELELLIATRTTFRCEIVRASGLQTGWIKSGIQVYLEADGTHSLYIQLTGNYYSSGQVTVADGSWGAGGTYYPIVTGSPSNTTTPPGTLLFDGTDASSFSAAASYTDLLNKRHGFGIYNPSTVIDVATSGNHGINLSYDRSSTTSSARLFFTTSGTSYAIQASSSGLEFRYGSTSGSSAGTRAMYLSSSGGLVVENSLQAPGITLTGSSNFSSGSSNTSVTVWKDLALFADATPTLTGTMKITLPVGWTGSMVAITVEGYNYAWVGNWRITVSGYLYVSTSNWLNYSATMDGDAPFDTIRLGYDGTKCCILLGSTTTQWSYSKIYVSQVVAGHSLHSTGWGTGWSIAPITDETGITKIVTCQINTGLNSDTVDGLHIHTGTNNEANKLVRTDSSGYLNAGWITTTSGDNGTTAISRVYASNDSFVRYYSLANFTAQIPCGSLATGTIPSARLSGAYTGITGLGTLTSLQVESIAGGSSGHTKILSSPSVPGQGGLIITQISAYTAGTSAFKLYATSTGSTSGNLFLGIVNQGTPDTVTDIMQWRYDGSTYVFGDVLPGTSAMYDLGSASLRFAQGHFTSGTFEVITSTDTIYAAYIETDHISMSNNLTTNGQIHYGINGIGDPTFTTRSVGTKIVLYPLVGPSHVDYAIGIASQTMWYSVPDTSRNHKWFAGTTELMNLTGTLFSVVPDAKFDGLVGIGGSPVANRRLYVNGNVRIDATVDTSSSSSGRTFSRWMQIDIAGTLYWVPVYAN